MEDLFTVKVYRIHEKFHEDDSTNSNDVSGKNSTGLENGHLLETHHNMISARIIKVSRVPNT